MPRSWDLFCRVIDNFGDAAVCWRLAQQLAAEHKGQVRLWIDRLEALSALCPEIAAGSEAQSVAGVAVRRWRADADFGRPAEIVIDAFGGGLPQAYVDSMAARSPRPAWIILEYLSAESWVGAHHRLPSPHPRLGLQRYFFFPGVVQGTGGVLREDALEARRGAFMSDPAAQASLWDDLGFAVPDPAACLVSLFGYENPAVPDMMRAWAEGPGQVIVVVTDSRIRAQAGAFFGSAAPHAGQTLTQGSLEARFLPFMPQQGYDQLLWACDWNFVRGEDSFVRAQWARRPFAWHIYPQPDHAHIAKLDAFLEVYCVGLEPGLASALGGLWRCWNAPGAAPAGQIGAAWKILVARREALRRHAEAWADRLALAGDLAGNLAQYCEERLK